MEYGLMSRVRLSRSRDVLQLGKKCIDVGIGRIAEACFVRNQNSTTWSHFSQ